MNLVINPESQRQIDAVLREKPHAVLLSGPYGVGLATIAKNYAKKSTAQLHFVLPEKKGVVDIEKGDISIDSIRRLYDMARTIEPKGRIVLIDYAERMAPAAQNAFLKLLEEPTPGTQFILLTHSPQVMLPTIISRVQHIDIRPITNSQTESLLNNLNVTNPTKRAQLLFIANGLPAELTRLTRDETAFELRANIIKDARSLVTGNAYTRLLLSKKYKDSRNDALTLIQDSLSLLRRNIASSGDLASLQALAKLELVHQRLRAQGNVRLQLSSTVML